MVELQIGLWNCTIPGYTQYPGKHTTVNYIYIIINQLLFLCQLLLLLLLLLLLSSHILYLADIP